jgi:hypothetical protein
MAYVISIEGSQGVGKSTLSTNLQKYFPNWIYLDEQGLKELQQKKANTHLKMEIEDDYYEIQKWYLNYEIKTFKNLKETDKCIVVRGPEIIDFFISMYPRTIGKNWDVERGLKNEFAEFRYHCQSNKIVFLDAPKPIIDQRVFNDTKVRPTAKYWMNTWHDLYRNFFMHHPKTTMLDTLKKKPEEVKEIFINWMHNDLNLEK